MPATVAWVPANRLASTAGTLPSLARASAVAAGSAYSSSRPDAPAAASAGNCTRIWPACASAHNNSRPMAWTARSGIGADMERIADSRICESAVCGMRTAG